MAIALVLGACGGAERPDPDEAFARIQEHEATIAHRQGAIERCEAGAPCPASDEACEAATAICELSEALEDADARARCDLARRSCPTAGEDHP